MTIRVLFGCHHCGTDSILVSAAENGLAITCTDEDCSMGVLIDKAEAIANAEGLVNAIMQAVAELKAGV